MGKGVAIYIRANKRHSTLYTGVSPDLLTYVDEDKTSHYPRSYIKMCVPLIMAHGSWLMAFGAIFSSHYVVFWLLYAC
jgi:predicted GIY-YIG superfamily endonuclease